MNNEKLTERGVKRRVDTSDFVELVAAKVSAFVPSEVELICQEHTGDRAEVTLSPAAARHFADVLNRAADEAEQAKWRQEETTDEQS